MTRHALVLLVGSILAASSVAADRIAAPPERAHSAFAEDPARRFDFWIGAWDVDLRMLQEDGTWQDSVDARASIYPILDGKAILELWDSEPIKGFSLRYHDPVARVWRLWLDWPQPGRSRLSSLEGAFHHGRGEFVSTRESPAGETTTSVYTFSDVTPWSLRWDDAYSTDGGATWRRNWIMEFTRTAVDPTWPIRRSDVPTWVDGGRCAAQSFRCFERMVGDWRGIDGQRFDAYPVLDGCAVIGFLDDADDSWFVFATFDTFAERWEAAVLDGEPGTGLKRYVGETSCHALATEDGEELDWTISGAPRITGDAGDELGLWHSGREWKLVRTGGGLHPVDRVEAPGDRAGTAPPARDLPLPAPPLAIPDARSPIAGVLTGGQPDAEHIRNAVRSGYRTVISLRTAEERGFEWEPALVRQLGMTYVSIPVAGAAELTRRNVSALDDALESALERGPVVLHCGSGNRVGALLALRAAWLEGLTAQQALEHGKDAGLTRLEEATRALLDAPARIPVEP